MNFLEHIRNFFKGVFLNPRATGAVLPSSKNLSRKMASYIDTANTGYVLELGPGTGAVTQAILDAHVPAHNLIALEIAPHFAQQLREEFPNVTIIEGNATMYLIQILMTSISAFFVSLLHVANNTDMMAIYCVLLFFATIVYWCMIRRRRD